MTQDPQLAPPRWPRRFLDDDAAESAKVQAELNRVRTSGGPPSTQVPPVPAVPYGGSDPDAFGVPPSARSVAPLASRPATSCSPTASPPSTSASTSFILLMGFVAPIAVWIFLPEALPAALVAAVVLIAWFRGRRYVRRVGVLQVGQGGHGHQYETWTRAPTTPA